MAGEREVCLLGGEAGEGPPQGQQPTRTAFVLDLWRWGVVPRPRILWGNLVALILLGLWAGLMWVAPYTVEEGTLRDLDGYVGIRDHPDEFDDLNPIARFMYNAGDKQCHQKDSRSLKLNGNEMPFCSRDVAIYTLLAIGVGITTFPTLPYHDRLTDIKWWWIVLGLVPIGIDGVGQLYGYWESTNLVRFLTGGLCGFVVGIALGFMLRELGSVVKEMREDLREWRQERRAMTPPPPEHQGEDLPGAVEDGRQKGDQG